MDVDLLSQLDATFNKKTVDILTFAESEDFCNKRLYPNQRTLLKIIFLMDLTPQEEKTLAYWEQGGASGTEIEISPFTRERMAYLKENGYPHFREIVLVGGRRSSKGFITGICLAYKVYQLLQHDDPIAYFGIDHDEILFSIVAAAQDQAADQQYADFANTVNMCKALQPYLYKLQELEFSVMTERNIRQMDIWKRKENRTQRLRDISSIRGKALPANSRTIRGSSTMALVFDEVGHFLQGENDQSDTSVYAAAIPSLAQFGRHGMIFLNSSPYSKTGILYEHFKDAMGVKEDGAPASVTSFGMRFPSWCFYNGWWEDPSYRGPRKCMDWSPDWDHTQRKEDGEFFYSEDDRYGILLSRDTERKDPDKFKVENRGHFAEVLDAYLNPESVNRMFQGVPNEQGTIYTPLQTNNTHSSNELQYRGHFDPSSTTAGFAFALGHMENMTVAGHTEEHVIFDVLKRWDPKDFPNSTIDWKPILEEILFWINVFRPLEITMDCHQNALPMLALTTEIRERNFSTHVYSKKATSELNWGRAESFKTALYRGLVHAPHDTPDSLWFELELKNLQISRTSRIPRVAHPDVGPVQTDDCFDAVAHVVDAFIGNAMARSAREQLAISPSLGAQGGYFQQRVTPRPFSGRDGEPLGQSNKAPSNRKLARARSAIRPKGQSPTARPFPK